MTTETALVYQERPTLEFYEEIIEVRGCLFSLDAIKKIYVELDKINLDFGKTLVKSLKRDDTMDDDQWEQHKGALLDDAFRLTVSITGPRDQHIYAEDAAVFSSENLPMPIQRIYFTNVTAFRRNANGAMPRNRIEVQLDFGKPDLFDPNPLVSEATPNSSNITINAEDISFVRAVQRVADAKVKNKKTWYGFIHKNFAYDVGLWFLVMPLALLAGTYYMDALIPKDGALSSYRWAFFIYVVGTSLLGYRFLSSYAKWAFPVNVLEDNRDRALKHRLAIGAVATWVLYNLVGIVEDLVFSQAILGM